MSNRNDQALRDIVKGAGIVYTGLVVEVIIAFFAQVLAARYLSVGGFGGLTVGMSIVNIGAILASLGLGGGLTRYLPRLSDDEKRAAVKSAFLFCVPTALAFGAILTYHADTIARQVFNSPDVAVSIRIFSATIPFAAVSVVAIGGIRGQKQSQYRVYVENILRPVVRFGLIIVAVIYGLKQAGFASAYAVPYVLGSIAATYYLHQSIPDQTAPIDWELTREIVSYSIPYVVSAATNFAYRSIDVFLILYFLGNEAVGVYGVAYAAGQLVLMFSAAFNFLGSPVASELEASDGPDEMLSVHQSVLRWLVVVSVPTIVPLALFPATFINTVYGVRYIDGALTLSILAVGFAISNFLSAQSSLLEALGNSRELAVNNTIAALINIGLNVVLIPPYGIFGAAVATVAAYLIRDGLMIVELWYHIGRFPLSKAVLEPIAVAVPLLAFGAIIVPSLPDTLLTTILFTAVFGGGYLLLLLAVFGLRVEEVMLIRSVQERLGFQSAAVDAFVRRFS